MSSAFKVPKSLAQCADLLYQTRQRRLLMQKDLSALEDQEKMLKEHLINNLPKSESSGIAGKVARVTIVTKPTPQAEDWDKIYAFIAKKKRFDLMQKRLNTAAIEELWENNIDVPGVKSFNVTTISMSKI